MKAMCVCVCVREMRVRIPATIGGNIIILANTKKCVITFYQEMKIMDARAGAGASEGERHERLVLVDKLGSTSVFFFFSPLLLQTVATNSRIGDCNII